MTDLNEIDNFEQKERSLADMIRELRTDRQSAWCDGCITGVAFGFVFTTIFYLFIMK